MTDSMSCFVISNYCYDPFVVQIEEMKNTLAMGLSKVWFQEGVSVVVKMSVRSVLLMKMINKSFS